MTETVATEKLNKKDVRRFTEGSLFKNILLFSLPLMLSQVLQVLFNISDVIIVGKGTPNPTIPVGAVGSNSTLLTLFTGFLIGLGAGINVRVAQYLGVDGSLVVGIRHVGVAENLTLKYTRAVCLRWRYSTTVTAF